MSKKPLTRDEQFLAKAAGDDVPMPKPLTRVQEFLERIVERLSGVEKIESVSTELKSDLTELDSELYDKKVSPNLFNTSFVEGDYLTENATGVVLRHDSDKWSLSDYIEVENSGEYDFIQFDNITGTNTPYRMIVYYFDSDKTYLSNANTGTETQFSAYGGKRFTVPTNAKYCRLQIYTTVLKYEENWFAPKNEYVGYYIPYGFIKTLKLATKEDVNGVLKEAKAYTDEQAVGKTIISESEYSWFICNSVKDSSAMYKRMIASNTIGDNNAEEYNLMQAADKYQHDATIAFSNNKLFVFYACNEVDTSDSADSPNVFVRLDRISINSSTAKITATEESIVVCKNGDIVDGKTIVSGCGQPNMVVKDSILYLYWSSKCNDDVWYEMYCTYDSNTNTLGSPAIMHIGDDLFTSSKIASFDEKDANIMISMNASIALLNGYYYALVCLKETLTNGVLIKSDDLIDWEFVSIPSFDGYDAHAQFEGAIGTLNGNLYLALRQLDLDSIAELNPMILAKLDSNGNVDSYVLAPSTTSRPSFFNRGTTQLYFCMPTNNRTNTIVLEIGKNIKDSVPKFDFVVGGNYLSCCSKSVSVFYYVRTQGKTGLRLGMFNYSDFV